MDRLLLVTECGYERLNNWSHFHNQQLLLVKLDRKVIKEKHVWQEALFNHKLSQMVKNVAYITLLWIYNNIEETRPLNFTVPGKNEAFWNFYFPSNVSVMHSRWTSPEKWQYPSICENEHRESESFHIPVSLKHKHHKPQINPLNPIWEDSSGRKALSVIIKASSLILLPSSLYEWTAGAGWLMKWNKIKLNTVLNTTDILMCGWHKAEIYQWYAVNSELKYKNILMSWKQDLNLIEWHLMEMLRPKLCFLRKA